MRLVVGWLRELGEIWSVMWETHNKTERLLLFTVLAPGNRSDDEPKSPRLVIIILRKQQHPRHHHCQHHRAFPLVVERALQFTNERTAYKSSVVQDTHVTVQLRTHYAY